MNPDEFSSETSLFWTQILLSAFIAAIGIMFFGGMMLYLTYYTTRLSLLPDTDQVHVETLRLWGRRVRTLSSNQVESTAYHEGKVSYSSAAPSVKAPWFWVKVHGGKGFLLDIQGDFFDIDAIAKLLSANHTVPIGGDVDRLQNDTEEV